MRLAHNTLMEWMREIKKSSFPGFEHLETLSPPQSVHSYSSFSLKLYRLIKGWKKMHHSLPTISRLFYSLKSPNG